MKCPNKDCNKDIAAPVIFADGSWYCSECGEKIIPDEKTTFRVTEENSGDLVISEKLFYDDWLPHKNNAMSGNTAKRMAALKEAIRLCKLSAFEKNPAALINLGYYYEHGYDTTMNVDMQRKAAGLCYRAVADNVNNTFENELNPTDNLLAEYKRRARGNLDSLMQQIGSGENAEGARYTASSVYGILNNVIQGKNADSYRIPMFGIFALTNAETMRLCSTGDGKRKDWERVLFEWYEIFAATCDVDCEKISDFEEQDNVNSIKTLASDNDGKCILLAFNVKKDKFKPKYMRKESLYKGSQSKDFLRSEDFRKLAINGLYNMVFSENDLFVCWSKEKGKNSLEAAIENVINKCKEQL